MNFRKAIVAIASPSLFISAMLYAWYASAVVNCGEQICLSTPEITSGEVVNDTYFSGPITLSSMLDEGSSIGKNASYSIDGGVNWMPAGMSESRIHDIPNQSNEDLVRNNYMYSDMTWLSNGNYLVAWVDGASLLMQQYFPTGEPASEITLISSPEHAEGIPVKPDVVSTANGGFAVKWERAKNFELYSYPLDFDGSVAEGEPVLSSWSLVDTIWLSYFDLNMNIQGEPHLVKEPINMIENTPSSVRIANAAFIGGTAGVKELRMMTNPSGGVVIPWSGSVDIFEGPQGLYHAGGGVTYSIVDDSGSIYHGRLPGESWPRKKLIPMKDGGFVMTWVESRLPEYIYDLKLQKLSPILMPDVDGAVVTAFEGARFGEEISSTNITLMDDGSIIVSWLLKSWANSWREINMQRFSSDLVELGDKFILDPSGNEPATDFRVKRTSHNELLVMWSYTSVYTLNFEHNIIGNSKYLTKVRFENNGNFIQSESTEVSPVQGFSTRVVLFNGIEIETVNWAEADLEVAPSLHIAIDVRSQDRSALFLTSSVSSPQITPTRDISVQFKVDDPDAGKTWYSPIRHYTYIDPNDGENGSVIYPDGYTNASSVNVDINMPCESCTSLQLFDRSAPLEGGQCGTFSSWTKYGNSSTLKTQVIAAVNDAQCYQYKAVATNSTGKKFHYTSDAVVKVDQAAPTISVISEQVVGDHLKLMLAITDSTGEIASRTYSLNSGDSTPFSFTSLLLPALNGMNRIVIDVVDAAGNAANLDHFSLADLSPPDILIHSIEDGGTYGNDLSLVYSLTHELTGLTIKVDGELSSDLSVLADGTHSLEISGYDSSGNLVTKKISFTKDSTLFSLTLLSPQSRTYENNTIHIDYQASKPVSKVWYTLNGGAAVQGNLLSELADGNYSLKLHAQTSSGEKSTARANFNVKDGVPTLKVTSPVTATVYPSNTVLINFASNSAVSYQLGTLSGTIKAGQTLSVPEDGEHTLVLSAKHPVSGNVVSQSINFNTDSLAPQITLNIPQASLYTFDSIPINFDTNKSLVNIRYWLDGDPVTTISNLTPGTHTFRIAAEDLTGRLAEQLVQFSVAHLNIVKPINDQVVISSATSQLPELPFEYSAQGNFSSFSFALDQGQDQLLVNPPGVVTAIPMAPGDHEIRLTGRLNEFSTAKRANFRIGAKNIRVGVGSIDYSYSNCDTQSNLCDVIVTLRVDNSGDYDINAPISVRFDHVAKAGFQTQWLDLPGLISGEKVEIALAPFQATLGDRFVVSVDPGRTIPGEWVMDNHYSLDFQSGQIVSINNSLSDDNVYLEGVTVLNLLDIDVAGPIARIELDVNGWKFIDANPADGFVMIADVGLLESHDSCLVVSAYSTYEVLLDRTLHCFPMKAFVVESVKPLQFPWASFADGNKVVDISNIPAQLFMKTLAGTESRTLTYATSLLPKVDESGKVTYAFISDPGAATHRPYAQTAELGDAPVVGDTSMANGHAIFFNTIDPSDNTCTVDGAAPVHTQPRYYALETILEGQLANIDEAISSSLTMAKLAEQEAVGEARDALNESLGNGLYKLFSSLIISAGGNPDAVQGLNNIDYDALLPPQIDGLPSIFLISIDVDYPDQFLEYTINGGIYADFVGDPVCLAFDENRGSVDMVMNGKFKAWSEDLSINIMTGKVKVYGRAIGGGLNAPGGNEIAGLSLVKAELKVYPVSISVPIDLMFEVGINIFDQRVKLGKARAQHAVSVELDRTLIATANIMFLDISLNGGGIVLYGAGDEYRAFGTLNGISMGDWIIGAVEDIYTIDPYLFETQDNSGGIVWQHQYEGDTFYYDVPAGEEFIYSEHEMNTEVQRRSKICFLGLCKHSSWRVSAKLSSYQVGTDGEAYDRATDVDPIYGSYDDFNFFGVNNLTSLGYFMLMTGLYGDENGSVEDYLACGTFQSLFMANMISTPLYSMQTGGCTSVPHPEFVDYVQTDYYTDASCQNPTDYKATSFLQYCQNNLLEPDSVQYLGNARAWYSDGGTEYDALGRNSAWTPAYGTTLDILSIKQENNKLPFVKQFEYKNVDGCSLEMRVYKQNIHDTNLKPAMVIHGGAWSYRGGGAVGAEPLISHLTERGFVVFSPYYRLIGDYDGPQECRVLNSGNGVIPGEAVIEDIESALQWVLTHGEALGSADSQVSLVGQSAGAHLSTWLATHHSQHIRNALLLYPPTDFNHFINDHAPYMNGTGMGVTTMVDFLGITNLQSDFPENIASYITDEIQLFADNNSFTDLARNAVDYPPVFMIHGNYDGLVPVSMSARMCDALKGVAYGTTTTDTTYDHECGSNRGSTNWLHVIDGADHILDLRCMPAPDEVLRGIYAINDANVVDEIALEDIDFCPSAGKDVYIGQVLNDAMNWLN